MLQAILNKTWKQHPTKQWLYSHLTPITKTIQVRRTRHAGHCWRSWDELISDVLLWIPSHGCAKAGRPPRTYIQQLSKDTGYGPGDLPEAMNDREGWRERVRDIRADGTARWWWWLQCITNNSIKHATFFNTRLNDQTFLFLAIQFSISHLFARSLNVSVIWSIYRTISGATTPGQSLMMEKKGNEEVLSISQSSRITEASLLDDLVSYQDIRFW